MDTQSNTRKIGVTVLAVVLWLATFILGLQAIYGIRDIVSLLIVSLGGSIVDAEHFAPWLIFILGLIFLVFIITTTEYHRKRIGQPVSWRLFAWSLGVEVSIIVIHYLL